MKKTKVFNSVRLLFYSINKRQKTNLFFLFWLTVINSVFEVVSIGAILPLVSLLIEENSSNNSVFFFEIINNFNFFNEYSKLTVCGIFFIAISLLSGSSRLFVLWYSLRTAKEIAAELGTKIYENTLYEPYLSHVNRNSSDVISGITQKVGTASSVILSTVTLFTNLFLFLSIILSLLYIDPVITFFGIVFFGISYSIIALISKNFLIKNSFIISSEQTNIIKFLQEGLGGIREVLINGLQEIYKNRYKKSVTKLQKANAGNTFINQSPRFLMETIAIIAIAVFVIFLDSETNLMKSFIPILAMFGLAAQKLLPLMQNLYGNWSVINASYSGLNDVLSFLTKNRSNVFINFKKNKESKKLFNKSIVFKNISFTYPSNSMYSVIKNLNITIKKGKKIGVVGKTGVGKSTFLDLLMGLLKPSSGKIYFDDRLLSNSNTKKFIETAMTYVPQKIFLSDSEIEENIAFGVKKSQIDYSKIAKIAKLSQISHLLKSRKNQTKKFNVGERGVKLSGGEIQRIAIARALYTDPEIIVLDEATSALDVKTEEKIIKSIYDLNKNITIIFVSHKMYSLKMCDEIYKLDNGSFVKIK